MDIQNLILNKLPIVFLNMKNKKYIYPTPPTREGWKTRSFLSEVQLDRDSIPDRVIPKTLKMVLDAYLLNTQDYVKE